MKPYTLGILIIGVAAFLAGRWSAPETVRHTQDSMTAQGGQMIYTRAQTQLKPFRDEPADDWMDGIEERRNENRLQPYGSCKRCLRTWGVVKGHCTWWDFREPGDPKRGSAPLCERCWSDLKTPEARIPYYRRHYLANRETYPEGTWAKIWDAVMSETNSTPAWHPPEIGRSVEVYGNGKPIPPRTNVIIDFRVVESTNQPSFLIETGKALREQPTKGTK